MNIRINEIYSKKMFPNLLMGKAKDSDYEKSLSEMNDILGNEFPIINTSQIQWTQLDVHGTWGHLCGAKIEIPDADDIYSFSVILNYTPEKENLEDKIKKVVSEIDWKTNSLKWNIGDW